MIPSIGGARRRGGSSGGGGGTFAGMASLFSSGRAGGYWDFADPAHLAPNADGSGGAPAVGDPVKWAADLSPHGNHLRNTVGSMTRTADGLQEPNGGNYGLFNMPGFGDMPAFASTVAEIILGVTIKGYGGSYARIIGSGDGAPWGLVQGNSAADKAAIYMTGISDEFDLVHDVRTTLRLVFGNGDTDPSGYQINGGPLVPTANIGNVQIHGLCIASGAGGSPTTPLIIHKLAVLEGRLNATQAAGANAWAAS